MRSVLVLSAISVLLSSVPVSAGEIAFHFEARADLSPEAERAASAKALAAVREAGHAAIEVGSLVDGLFRPGMLLPEFDAAPPKGWPEALREAWTSEHRICRERVERERQFARGINAPSVAARCQQQLARKLYARLIAHLAPDRVLEVGVAKTGSRPADPLRLTVVLYAPGAEEDRRLSREMSRAGLERAISESVAALLSGGGEPGKRARPHTTP